jgi:hypothetical protein
MSAPARWFALARVAISLLLATDIVTPIRITPEMGVTNSAVGRFAFAPVPDIPPAPPAPPGIEVPPEKPAPDKVPQ